MGPLAGVRVLELAQVMAGPVCGLMLADLGADVVKVEKTPDGDDTRRYDRPSVNGESAPFMMLNRGKRGIALDLKSAGGREALRRMARRADVLLENFRTGALAKLGLGYAELRAANPQLVYCSITGWGASGPYAARGGFDLVAQGASGLMSYTGEPGREPAKVGSPVTDINAGILAALGIASAYAHRLRTGEGQYVDTSLFEAGLQQSYWHAAVYFATGESPGPSGSAHLLAAPYQAFRSRDGWIAIGGANQANWERIARVLGAPEWLADARFRTNAERMRHRAALAAAINERLASRASRDWLAALEAAGVPCGPIHTVGEALSDPQALARGMVLELEHPRAGRTRAVGPPIKFSATASDNRRPAPLLGEHTREVLADYGFAPAEIESLLSSGAALAAATAA
jgi:crotonobetainyl-CoA:carnitine CoA-transferase CaiB-like acyl-CoA transferase